MKIDHIPMYKASKNNSYLSVTLIATFAAILPSLSIPQYLPVMHGVVGVF